MIRDRVQIEKKLDAYRMVRVDETLNRSIAAHGLEKGVLKISAPEGCVITTIEFEAGLVEDFTESWKKFETDLKPVTPAEILGKLVNGNIILPFNLGRLVIGYIQQVVVFTLAPIDNLALELEFIPNNSILGLESIQTNAELQTLDITDIVERTLMNARECNVTMISPDPSVILYTLNPFHFKDMTDFLKNAAPKDMVYRHSHEWASSVGYIHVRASYFSQALTVKVTDGQLALGGERLFFTELDTQGTKRDIYFEVWK